MGSKASLATPNAHQDADRPDLCEPEASSAARLLQRVAAALQVPASALYGPPNAVVPASGPGDAVDLDGECAELMRVYRQVRDPAERRRLLDLVCHAAERA